MRVKRMRIRETVSFVNKGSWRPEEDALLLAFVARHGPFAWNTARDHFPSLCRTGKSCRLRYTNQLRPGIRHQPVSPEEEDRIMQLHRVLGNQWSKIAGHLHGRTDNTVKNVVNMHLKRAHRQQQAGRRRLAGLRAALPGGVLNVSTGMVINIDQAKYSGAPLSLQGGVPASCRSEVISAQAVQSLLPAAGPSSQNGNGSGFNWAALLKGGQLPSVQMGSGEHLMVPELTPSALVDNDVVSRLATSLCDMIARGSASPAPAGDKDLLEAVYAAKPGHGSSSSSRYNATSSAHRKQVIDDSYIGAVLQGCALPAVATPTLQMMDYSPASPQQDFALDSVENGSPAGMMELDMGRCDLASMICSSDWETMPAAVHADDLAVAFMVE